MQENKILPSNKYTQMQSKYYEEAASTGDGVTVDNVVGSFQGHNLWKDYKYLFSRIQKVDLKDLKVLDFGCGPGRNIVKYKDTFKQIDGVDISKNNLKNAKNYFKKSSLPFDPILYHCNGVDLSDIPDNTYDVVMSTVTLQHICVHEIRYNYFKEFFRVLKPNGCIALQMGCGSPSPSTVPYDSNYYDAPGTNRSNDCEIAHPIQLNKDLYEIGYSKFSYLLGPVGPGDVHPFWIYFNAQKPNKEDIWTNEDEKNISKIHLEDGYN